MTARVAVVPWGNVIEDFLDPLGLTLVDFRDEMTGGWLFGYFAALQHAGVEAAIVCVSRDPRAPVSWRHGPTGAEIIVLPVPRAYHWVRSMLEDPYSAEPPPSPHRFEGVTRFGATIAHGLLGYLATPVGRLAGALRDGGFTALLCQEYEFERFDACVAGRRLLGVPVYATYQGGAEPRTRLERLIRPHTMRVGAGYIIGSKAECRRVESRYAVSPERIAQVFNPLDVRLWSSGDRERVRSDLAVQPSTVVVAWHGRVDLHRKGLDVLLHAWQLLSDREGLPDRRLLLVGSGNDAVELRRRLDEHGVQNVHWIDEYVLDKVRMAGLLSAADLYVFPSRHEGFPVAPLEAMAAGLPLVSTDAPGIAEILPEGERSGGMVVPAGDGAALAEGLEALICDPIRRRVAGDAARARVEEAFSLETVGRKLRAMLAPDLASV